MSRPLSEAPIEYWFIFQKDQLLLLENNLNLVPTTTLIAALALDFLRLHSIPENDDISCQAAEISEHSKLPAYTRLVPLRKAFELLGMDWFKQAVKAYSIINWDRNHQFCGRCATPTQQSPHAFERRCPACLSIFYPRISPCIIVLIQKGAQLLMARSPHFPPGAYGLIAGFVETGESLEEAIHREVKEEVGIEIKNISYFDSQPWPFPDSLMIGFRAEYAAGEIVVNLNELESAGWYPYDQLPGLPSVSLSIAKKLIDHFLLEQQKIF
jgi:NAD+ diphosphatase